MLRRRPRVVAIRLALAAAWLVVPTPVVGPAPAHANVVSAEPGELSVWLSDTAARALQAAGPDNDLAAAGREAMKRSVALGLQILQEVGPAWLRRVTLDVSLQDDLQIAYDIAATEPLLRSWRDGDRLWLRGHFRHEPTGKSLGDLGLFYRQRLLGEELTLGVSGAVEDRWLLDYQRVSLGTTVRSRAFELSASAFDDLPGRDLVERGAPDRRLDGYDVAIAVRLPQLRWVRVQARKHWEIVPDGDRISESDRLSLQLTPFAPLEVETGTAGAGEDRSWFARLRLKLELGG